MKLIFKSKICSINYAKPILVTEHKILKNNILEYQVFRESNTEIYSKGTLQLIPYFHHSNLHDLEIFLHHFFEKNSFDFNQIDLTQQLFNTTKAVINLDLEYLYCIEAILFQICFDHFRHLLPEISNNPIRVNALARIDDQLVDIKTNCLKVKIFPSFTNESLSQLKKVLLNKPNMLIRFDGNRQFTVHQLQEFLERLIGEIGEENLDRIEYIEEPLSNPLEYQEIFLKFKIPQALDESVLSFEKWTDKTFVSTLVLKPSVLSLSKCFFILKNSKVKCIISSTYEMGQSLLGHLFLAQEVPRAYHGLGTLDFLPKNYTNIPTPFFLSF